MFLKRQKKKTKKKNKKNYNCIPLWSDIGNGNNCPLKNQMGLEISRSKKALVGKLLVGKLYL